MLGKVTFVPSVDAPWAMLCGLTTELAAEAEMAFAGLQTTENYIRPER
jgi:hypothetical protein